MDGGVVSKPRGCLAELMNSMNSTVHELTGLPYLSSLKIP